MEKKGLNWKSYTNKKCSVSILHLLCKFQEDRSKNKKSPKFVKIKFPLFIHLIHNDFPILLVCEAC